MKEYILTNMRIRLIRARPENGLNASLVGKIFRITCNPNRYGNLLQVLAVDKASDRPYDYGLPIMCYRADEGTLWEFVR